MNCKAFIIAAFVSLSSLALFACGDSSSSSNGEPAESSIQAASSTKASSITKASSAGVASSSATASAPGEPLVYSGQTYGTVVIGDQTWMAENLNYVPETDSTWCTGNIPSNCDTYGRLYSYVTAMKVCPTGWRLPDTSDWKTLERAVGADKAGKMLKAETLWSAIGKGSDDFGFAALPGGYGYEGTFEYLGESAYWWTSTSVDEFDAWYVSASEFNSKLFYMSFGKTFHYSVRCIKE